MRAFVVAISCLLLVGPGLAQASEDSATTNGTQPSSTATQGNNSSSTVAGEDGERQICRRVETNTGSRVPWRRLCMTEREWRVYNRHD
jgi:hypothetical protein